MPRKLSLFNINLFTSNSRIAYNIIVKNSNMVLGTSTKSGKPWATPVTYAYDGEYNFYFISDVNSTHAKNIMENPNVSVTIADLYEQKKKVYGVQAEATSYAEDENLDRDLDIYFGRLYPEMRKKYNADYYRGSSEFRLFKVIRLRTYLISIER